MHLVNAHVEIRRTRGPAAIQHGQSKLSQRSKAPRTRTACARSLRVSPAEFTRERDRRGQASGCTALRQRMAKDYPIYPPTQISRIAWRRFNGRLPRSGEKVKKMRCLFSPNPRGGGLQIEARLKLMGHFPTKEFTRVDETVTSDGFVELHHLLSPHPLSDSCPF